MKYLLLLKRLLKKKSYIAMLLVVPLMVLMLNAMSAAPSGLMTIGVYIPGDDSCSKWLKENLESNPGSLLFKFYDDADAVVKDVESQQLTEGWIVPEDLDTLVDNMATKGKTKTKIEIVIRESGLTHMLGREVLSSRVYPMIARQMAIYYISKNVYGDNPTEDQLNHIIETYDNYEINGNLFEMGYVDGTDNSSEDTNYLMMPLRGILALWLLLCGIAASMYYLEDEANGLFIWWKTRFFVLRDLLYYLVIIFIPTIMVLVGLYWGGVFTSLGREIATIAAYDFVVIVVAIFIREIIHSIKGLGIVTPILIMASAMLSPVFIDFKEGRALQRFCPTFHYLYSIHDLYYLKSLLIYGIAFLILWYIINTIKRHSK
ncbi:ABC transporter permease [Pseudobutyrivibrio sp. LB2011]|uniref:ABC transporter permease n=1 Tax=Pseudobutyrivibrio sp. LB2011 TaxID=1408312 RepID=UPI0009DEB4F8|nr:ABC transporter permease [Pseudobutyrivibrio sp. LB2011]